MIYKLAILRKKTYFFLAIQSLHQSFTAERSHNYFFLAQNENKKIFVISKFWLFSHSYVWKPMEARSRHLKKKYNSVSHNNEILSHNNDLVSCYIEKVSHNNDLVSHNNDLFSHNNDLVSHNNDFVSHNNDLVSHNNDFVSHNNDLVSHNNDFVSRNNEKLSRNNDLLLKKKKKKKKTSSTHAQCKSDGTLATSAGQSHAGTPQTLLVL